MELQELLEKRKSIRKYLNKEVKREDLEKIIDATRLAPSWKNSQVIRYHVVTSKEMLNQIKLSLPEFNQENVKDAPVLIISSYIKNRSGFKRSGEAENEVGNGWGCYDVGMHDMILLLKARELGLSSLVMGIRDASKIKDILNIEEDILSVIALGYSEFDPERPSRKSINEIVKFY